LRKHRHRVAQPDLTALGCSEPGGSYIGQQNHLFVGKRLGNHRQVCLGIGYQGIFRLNSVNGVPETPTAERTATLRPVTPQAGLALSARSNRPNQHALANRTPSDTSTELVDYADCLMAECQARLHRILATHNVNVGPADGGQLYLDHCFPGTRSWNRLFL